MRPPFPRLLLLALACLLGSVPALSAEPPAALPEATMKSLGIPVKSVRIWLDALSPNPRGGYNVILQTFNSSGYLKKRAGAKENPLWLVVDLQTGKCATQEDLPGPGVALYSIQNQLRTANGRIFFPLAGNSFAYYDPQSETLKGVPPLISTKDGQLGPSIFYRVVVGPDGLIYGTTQSNDGYTYLGIVNPDTLETKVIPKLGGKRRKDNLTYGYWLKVTPPWTYVIIGQNAWSLVAVNTETGEQRILSEREEPYLISFNGRGDTFCATIRSAIGEIPDDPKAVRQGNSIISKHVIYYPELKMKAEYFFCVEGKLVPAEMTARSDGLLPPSYKPVTVPPMANAPEIDAERLGTVKDDHLQIFWRPAGSVTNAPWKVTSVPVNNVEPIPIESLAALPDGSVMGSTLQYNGFFRWLPKKERLEYYGKHGPSRAKTAVMNGLFWFTGYPKCHLWSYDPSKPWNAPKDTDMAQEEGANPRLLGNFAEADAHYAYFLQPLGDRRLYMLGRRERSGRGSAIGYYDVAAGTFAGHHRNLETLAPRGLVVLPELQRVVLSGQLDKGQEGPQLVVFDVELKEIERLVLKPGLANGGSLYPGATGTRIIGNVDQADLQAIYLYDLREKRLVSWIPLEFALERLVWNPKDRYYWAWQNGMLVKLDPSDLKITPVAAMPKMPHHLAWQGDTLYAGVDGELFRIVF
ncbi:MAG: hypothetical protein IT578_01670 [Verrucomicrobiae bacterium]|nr:hypothetical protein [Verrucomicrobiae bacterium]